MSIQAWNFLDEPPSTLRGKFDIVHIRLIGIIFDQGPLPAIRNIALLLKPHGYLQWEEMDLNQTLIATADDSVPAHAVTRMDAMMKTHRARTWVPQIPSMLEKSGFHDARRYDVQSDMALLKFSTDMHVQAWAEVAANQPEGSERRERITKMIEEVREETGKVVGYGAAKLTFVARKDG
ncbi:MAG: hypothetical protein Q9207_004521 [Kuettlingeria erythrocarpa]